MSEPVDDTDPRVPKIPPSKGDPMPATSNRPMVPPGQLTRDELEPELKPVSLLEAEAFETVHDIEVITTPNGSRRLKLNGQEIPLYIPTDYAPSVGKVTGKDANGLQVISVPFLVEAGVGIVHTKSLSNG